MTNPARHSPAPKSFDISRRLFLKRCSQIAAMTGLPLWFIERQQLAAADMPSLPTPNDRPGIALVGCGGMGRGDATNASKFGEILAVCDVDGNHAAAAAKKFTVDGKVPDIYSDFRKVMESARTSTSSSTRRPTTGIRWSTWPRPGRRRTSTARSR